MSECGCYMSGEFFRFPGPDESVYILQIYPGCKDCSTPIGVQVHQYSGEYLFFAEGYPPLKFDGGEGEKHAAETVLDPNTVRRALSAFMLREMKKVVRDKIGADQYADDAVSECLKV